MKTALISLIVFIQLLGFSTGTSLADSNAEQFFGRYVGSAVNDGDNELPGRKMEVTIKPYKKGFNVKWSTTSFRAKNKVKKSTFTINFKPSKEPGVYGSAMSKDVFGHERPLDPLKGDPFVWAHLDGKTMTVNSLLVAQDGGYEIQTYERTLVEDGMELVFSRVQNGKIKRQIKGSLKKVE